MSIQIENEIVSIDTELIKNPILDDSKSITLDGEKLEVTVKNAWKYFNSAIVIVPFNKNNIDKFYFEENISVDNYISMTKNLLLYKLNNLSILSNKIFSKQLKVLDMKTLIPFNHFNVDLEENNLVIKVLSISFLDLNNFLKMYQKENTIEDLHKFIIMSEYFKLDKNHIKTHFELTKRLKELDGIDYYTKYFNLNKNTNYLFRNRKFQKQKKKSKEMSDNYQNIIIGINKTFDICNLQNKLGKRIFFVTKPVNFTKEQATLLFNYLLFDNSTLTKRNIYMFNYFLANPKLCHLVLNNYNILSKMITFVQNDKYRYRYLLSYAWLRFYNDEQVLKNKITKDSDIVMDINTASLLPVYEVPEDYVQWNPYLPIMVSKKNLKIHKNIGGIPYYVAAPDCLKNSGISNFLEFQKKMNIFITGRADANVFQNINLKDNDIYVVGSVIEACLQKSHVLLNLFKNTNKLPTETNEEAIFRRFCAEYYSGSSDIDIMVWAPTNFEFCKKVRNLYNELLLNFCNFYRDAEPAFFKLQPIKIVGLFVNKSFVEELIKKKNISFSETGDEEVDLDMTYKYMEDHMHCSEVVSYFKEFISENYQKFISQELESLSENDKKFCQNFVPELTKNYNELEENNINIDYNIRIVEKIYGSDNNYHMNIQTKYKINSPFMSHPFEIFKTKSQNPWDLIHKFHLNCVRGYYNGENVYLLPSCISAHMTYWNMDAKYFAGKKSPYEIINRRRLRGFGTFLNKNEIKDWANYSKNQVFWQNIYKISDNLQRIPLGTIPIGNPLYQPRLVNADFYIHDSIQVDEQNLYCNIKNLKYTKCTLESVKNINLLSDYNKPIIDSSGNINPIDLSLVHRISSNSNNIRLV